MSDLPPGFVVADDLPPGFVVEPQKKAPRSLRDDLSKAQERRSLVTGKAIPEGETIDPAVARSAGVFGGGFNRQAADVVASVPELAAAVMRTIGIPVPERGFYQSAARGAVESVTGPAPEPQNGAERFIAGAGKGVANAASVMIPATAAANATRAGTVTGEVVRALAAQPVTQGVAGAVGGGVEEVTGSPWAGIGASFAVPVAATLASATARRLAAPVTNSLDPRRQQLADLLAREGVELRPSQATGSKTLRQIEETVGRFPGAIDRFAAQQNNQQQQFTRAAARYMGEDAAQVTPDVLASARARIGQDFDTVASRTTVRPDVQLVNDMQTAVNAYAQQLPAQQRPQFGRYVDDLLSFVTAPGNPQMPGKSYQTIRSQLQREISSLNGPGSDKRYQDALIGIRDALDGAFARSVGPEDANLYQQARAQWAALRTLENAVARDGGGDIKPGALATAAMSRRRDQYARSLGQMDELAKAGKEFIPNQIPNSGTPERAAVIWAGAHPIQAAPVAATANLAQRALEAPAIREWLTTKRLPAANYVTPELLASILAANRDRIGPAMRETSALAPAR